jgi:large subunit ribosomal protein L17
VVEAEVADEAIADAQTAEAADDVVEDAAPAEDTAGSEDETK